MKKIKARRHNLFSAAFAVAAGGILSHAAFAQASTEAAAEDGKSSALEEVVVTGTLLAPSGFTAPTPVTAIGEDMIAQRSPNNVSDLLREIPSLKISSGSGITGTGQRTSVGVASVDFYGLSAPRTLVLIDGQRSVNTTIIGTFDINTIPTMMIERIDTITGGASATYGSDAISGVANFILRSKMDGFRVNAAYSVSGHNDKQVPSLALGYGTSFGNRANLVVGVDLTKDSGIESMYERDWGRREPGLFTYGNASAARGAQPARLWVTGYEQKTVTPGGIITGCTPSPCPASLTNIAFDASGNPYTFVPGTTTASSSVMYGTNSNYGNNPNGQLSLFAATKRGTGMAKLTIDLTDDTQLRLTAGYSAGSGKERLDVVNSSGITVATSNPYLPASTLAAMNAAGVTSITVGRSNFDLGYGYTELDYRALSSGAQLTGKIAGSWSYDVYYKFSQAITDAWASGFRNNDINASLRNCTTTSGASPGCVGYDIFGVGQASQAALDYLNQYDQGFRVYNKQNIVQGLVRGTPFSTWAGDVNVGAGALYLAEDIARSLTKDSPLFATAGVSSGFTFSNYSAFSGSRNVKEYFGEAGVPLAKDLPLLQALNANLGFRHQRYSDNGGYNTWKAGLTWDMNDQVRLRATRSRDMRVPLLFVQYGTSAVSNYSGVTDPRTGLLVNSGSSLPASTPANPALRPEIAYTSTVGLILQPRFASGLRMSVDYFNIKIGDVITRTVPQQIINGCFAGATELCQYITFSNTGVITFVSTPQVNFNQLDVAGYNAEIDYSIPMQFLAGNWNVRGLVTYLDKFTTLDRFTNVAYNDVGTGDAGQSRLQTNLLLTYTHGPFSTTAAWRYLSGLKYSSSTNGIWVGPDDPLYYSTVNSTTTAPCPGGAATCQWYQTASNSISQNKFSGVGYFNWSAQYDFAGESGHFKELQAYVNVDNVFDRDPPEYAAVAFSASTVYDLIGRTYKVGIRAHF